MKITLEADGHNPQVLTDEDIKEQGVLAIANLVLGWLCIFYEDIRRYSLQKTNRN